MYATLVAVILLDTVTLATIGEANRARQHLFSAASCEAGTQSAASLKAGAVAGETNRYFALIILAQFDKCVVDFIPE